MTVEPDNAGVAGSAAVDAYLARTPEPFRQALADIRALLRSAAPDAREALVYGVPGIRQKGPLVCYAAFKAHCGFYPMDPVLLERFAPELTGFKTAKGTIQFTPDQPVPADLILRIVAARLEQDKAKGGRRG